VGSARKATTTATKARTLHRTSGRKELQMHSEKDSKQTAPAQPHDRTTSPKQLWTPGPKTKEVQTTRKNGSATHLQERTEVGPVYMMHGAGAVRGEGVAKYHTYGEHSDASLPGRGVGPKTARCGAQAKCQSRTEQPSRRWATISKGSD